MASLGRMLAVCMLLPILLSGCWSSQEIEDLALYAGLALDKEMEDKTEREMEARGAKYPKTKKITATLQIVPIRTVGNTSEKQGPPQMPYTNISGTGDSILEIFRQFTIRLDQPIIGHHLKVIVISAELLKEQAIENVTDFLLRDNDIRPSTMVFVSQGPAKHTLMSRKTNNVPSFHIMGMLRNRTRTSKVLAPVTLNNLDSLIYTKKSFALQNIASVEDEVEFSGAGIIKGNTGHWIGTLDQTDTQCLAWLKNEGSAGVIKEYVPDKGVITYEIKEMKSKISADVSGGALSFNVKVATEGRIIEIWQNTPGEDFPLGMEETTQVVEDRIDQMMQTFIHKLQKTYKADVAGFGDRLAIQHPAEWKKVKNDWDEVFSRSKINFTYEVNITDYGSFAED
ncbi:Ger(x)C family spore germination protein [Paenibacillus sp. 1P07SE]|uniref:Ger(x)C family spore germination protein n=1 Tax=Paenibacillus sp. 1P07SE TaxID=3132209 RepID=UPI0039A66BF7